MPVHEREFMCSAVSLSLPVEVVAVPERVQARIEVREIARRYLNANRRRQRLMLYWARKIAPDEALPPSKARPVAANHHR